MSIPLEFHLAVRDEVDAARDWYEQQRIGLGRGFVDEVERVLAEISSNPARFGFANGDVREGLLHRFPYAIYYRVLTDRIRILAVYHSSRDPSGWKSRI